MGNRLHRFRGGIHLPSNKAISVGKALESAPLFSHYTLPLNQHIGNTATPIVSVGESVLKGQMVARANGSVSAPIHAPTSGRISAIEKAPIPHPSGLHTLCITLESDGKDRWCERQTHSDHSLLDGQQLRHIIGEAGIVGLGGAGFPAYLKLNPGGRTAVDTLVLNGAECEPYITCDDLLMRERPEQILVGAKIMRHALQARHCIIAIEDNKPEAIAAMKQALSDLGGEKYTILTVPTRYPTGGERQLIQVITGREVPLTGLPLDIGVVCHNVATAASVYNAVIKGEPLISRVVTITGEQANSPRNMELLIGSTIDQVLAAAGGVKGGETTLTIGGPMMGFALHDRTLPLVKTTNCLLLRKTQPPPPVRDCIRCGECARVCPASLLPQKLYWHASAREFEQAQDYDLFACIECGCCNYVCPSKIPLVSYYRFAKTEIWTQEREQRASDHARRRYEARTARKEREKAERKARSKKRVKKPDGEKNTGTESDKQRTIREAMERVEAKRAKADRQNTATEGANEKESEQSTGRDESER